MPETTAEPDPPQAPEAQTSAPVAEPSPATTPLPDPTPAQETMILKLEDGSEYSDHSDSINFRER